MSKLYGMEDKRRAAEVEYSICAELAFGSISSISHHGLTFPTGSHEDNTNADTLGIQ